MNPTIRRIAWGLAALLLVVAPGAAARGQPSDPRYKALEAEYNRLANETRTRLYKESQQLRARAAQEADLSGLRAQIHQAKQAYEQKLKNSPEILAAAKAVEQASEGTKTAAVKAQNDPRIVEMRDAFAQAEKDYEHAQFQGRLSRFYLMEIKRRITYLDTVRAKRDQSYQAERVVRNFAENSQKLVDAKQAIKEAQGLYLAKRKELGKELAEDPRIKKAQEAVDEARKTVNEAQQVLKKAEEVLAEARKLHAVKAKSLPEAKAVEKAKAAYDAMLKSDPEYLAAQKAAELAQQAYRDEIEMATASDGDASEYNEKLEQAQALEKESRTKSRELREKIRQAERDAERGHPLVKAAAKAYEKARKVHGETVTKQTDAERKAVSKLEYELGKKVSVKLAADPRNKLIQDELKKASARMYEIRNEMKALLKGSKKNHKKKGR